MIVEEALVFLDTALQQNLLNNLQELVLRQAWAGQTYQEMAESVGYHANYIKDVGGKLWELLSKVFGEKVTKSNFRSVLRRHYFASQHVGQADSLLIKFEDKEDNVSISVDVNESSAKPHLKKSLGLGVSSTKEIFSLQQITSPQEKVPLTPIENTVLGTPLDADNKNVFSQNNKINLSKATPKLVRQDWLETIDVLAFYGRTEELNTLEQWIVDKLLLTSNAIDGRNWHPQLDRRGVG